MDALSLSLGALVGAGTLEFARRRQEHRPTPEGLADILQWAFLVDDGIVLNKDGALCAGWRYQGPDLGAATPYEVNALSQHVNDALLPFGDGWMLHVDAIRSPAATYAPMSFPDPVSALIDEERRMAYAHGGQRYESAYRLVLSYLPPPELYSRAAQYFVQGGDGALVDWDAILRDFRKAITDFEGRLSVLSAARLDSDALLTHLHTCLTGLRHSVAAPPVGAYLDYVLADQEFVGGWEPQIGTMHIRPIHIAAYPEAVGCGSLDFLNELPIPYRWSNRLITLDRQTADTLIKRHQLTWFKKRKGAGAWIREIVSQGAGQPRPTDEDERVFLDADARRNVSDAAEALAENASGTVRFAYYNQVLVVMEPERDHADRHAAQLVKALNDRGFTARVETVNAQDAFFGTLPGHGYPNVRRPLMSSANIADTLPVTSIWPGLEYNPSGLFPPQSPPLMHVQTAGSTPFRLHLHDTDVGHTLVIGATGAGKSTLVDLTITQFLRYPRAQVFVYDIGYSAWTIAHAIGARHYDVTAGADALRFQPLALIDAAAERVWASGWLETLIELQGVRVTPIRRGKIDQALVLLAQLEPEHRTLSELLVHLQDHDLAAALRPYTGTGPYGYLLDATTDALTAETAANASQVHVFELRHLMDLDEKILVPVLLYLFRRMERRLDGSPTLIIVEEMWAALLRSAFTARLQQWLLTLRKQNAAVVLVAHSVAQLAAIPNRAVFTESCPTRICLPNADAVSRESRALYADLGFNDREIALIASATPKRHYYFKSPRGSRLFELGLGAVARAFLAVPDGYTAAEARSAIADLITRHAEAWPGVWLRQQGLTIWADRFDALLVSEAQGTPAAAPADVAQLSFDDPGLGGAPAAGHHRSRTREEYGYAQKR